MYLVYKHTSPSGKSYIGITNNYERRCTEHRSQKQAQHRPFPRAIKKYGWDAFTHTIIAEGVTQEEARALEVHLIRELNTTVPYGYNGDEGGGRCGNGPRKPLSEAHRQAISAANRSRFIGPPKPAYVKIGRPKARHWIATSPAGEQMFTDNLAALCRAHNLDPSAMRQVALGKFPQHKGWSCCYGTVGPACQ